MKPIIEELINDNSLKINKENIQGISESIVEELLSSEMSNYFEILNAYINKKKEKDMSTSVVARTSEFPELTIKRFENIQSIPKVTNLIKVLHSVGLKLIAVPIDEE